ncbi:MAG TPA: hypothetical protein VFX37_03365 [Pseudolabrys sp.]|nr:hypothetical protein [Pseudolabrys sp.]
MLPIFRMIPVGGVFIAIIALVQAMTLPGPSRTRLIRVEAPARGPLIEREEHPEWRQFLILAAIHRAHEILALRDLAVTSSPVDHVAGPVAAHTEKARRPKLASLPIAPASPDLVTPPSVQPSVEELAVPGAEQNAMAVTLPAAAPIAAALTGTADSVTPELAASSAVADSHHEKMQASANLDNGVEQSPAPSPQASAAIAAAAPASDPALVTHDASALQEATNVAPGIETTAERPAAKKLASIAPPTATDSVAPSAAVSTNVHAPERTTMPQPSAATGGPKEQSVGATPKATVIAELPRDRADTASTANDINVTGSVVKSSATTMPVGIGEASSIELPVVLPRPRPNLIKLPRSRPAVIPPLRHSIGHRGKPKTADPNARRNPPDLFSALFDKKYRHPESNAAKPMHAQASHAQEPPGQSR